MKNYILSFLALIVIVVVSFPTGFILEHEKDDNLQQLLSKSLSSKKMSLLSLSLKRNVFNEVNGKTINYKFLNVKFYTTKDLLNKKITDFYSVRTNISYNTAKVVINHYKSGEMFSFDYRKNNNKWVETSRNWAKVKFEPSKPYYIYLENMRLTNPRYKNYNISLIPRDSLK